MVPLPDGVPVNASSPRPESEPELSVVIPARNVAATLREQLDALTAQEWSAPFEIVVIDNESTDETPDIVGEYAARDPRVRLVEAHGGSGVNFVRNVGIAAARANHVAVCDGDDIVQPGWVAAMGDALREHPIVTGPVNADMLNPAWLVRTRGVMPMDRLRMLCDGVPLASGGNIGMHRDVWESVGRYSETIVGAVDDAEFCLRLWQHGIPVHFARGAELAYRYRAEPSALWRHGRFYGRGRPYIAKRLKEAGLPAPSRFANWRSWLLLVAWLPRLTTAEGRASWCWVAGCRIGQLEGCFIARTLYL